MYVLPVSNERQSYSMRTNPSFGMDTAEVKSTLKSLTMGLPKAVRDSFEDSFNVLGQINDGIIITAKKEI